MVRKSRRSLVRAGAVLAAVTLMTGVFTSTQATGSELASQGTNGATVPELSWGPCAAAPPGYECAEAEVPLSYRDPHGQRITLALGKLPAADQAGKLGTIFYNPGGPGGSGQIPPELTPELHERFDIVGFDPRGIGSSTPLRCFPDRSQSRLLGGEFPITLAQERKLIEDTAKGTALCAENAGPLINHMSTANVARDMDLLRQAVGEEMTSYYGISYGSHLGSVYANLFPDKVGSLVIDAVLDPVEWTTGHHPAQRFEPFSYRLGSHLGSEHALKSFFEACSGDERCAFDEPGVDLADKYDRILDRLRQAPVSIPSSGGEQVEITYQDVVRSTLGSLYSADASTSLAEFLQALSDAIDPAARLTAADAVQVPEPVQGPGYQQARYSGPEQGMAVFCADSSNPGNPHSWSGYARKADRGARGFGSNWTWLSLACATWPGHDRDHYAGPWDRETANPVLVVGNGKGDPATPYEDAQSTAKLLGNARLLTLDTFGHGALGNSKCIAESLNTYFIEGTLPAEGTVCQPDRGPFDQRTPVQN
ncbi:alpha/beta hydrolase fold [Amycolatopsis marina]|uniref:Alpha/beta hydrolase fold n=1 Tax=Amycolatopsis marina TaxID=490629 RepID=A0A1I0ZSJ9_9PSEU|nr:alpha/beta hydrolase [Amycolatopsis marina]SFB27133.1 alpha/beta hydrolase fold [Amycolatopsis marina]